jgi:hypothetical protein
MLRNLGLVGFVCGFIGAMVLAPLKLIHSAKLVMSTGVMPFAL